MLQILLHSSKTMSSEPSLRQPLSQPQLLPHARQLVQLWRHATRQEIISCMKVSDTLANEVQQLFDTWTDQSDNTVPAIDAFRGDIYSGLQASSWTDDDRAYAQQHLVILSGLYGVLRACDGVAPYRLEMGYKLPNGQTMYQFWGDTLASAIDLSAQTIVNLSAVEYTKALLPYIHMPVVTPKFLTVSPKTNEPIFVTVHTKIARGAFARWLIQARIDEVSRLPEFAELGYVYDAASSTPEQPVFVCEAFEGLGLSVRK